MTEADPRYSPRHYAYPGQSHPGSYVPQPGAAAHPTGSQPQYPGSAANPTGPQPLGEWQPPQSKSGNGTAVLIGIAVVSVVGMVLVFTLNGRGTNPAAAPSAPTTTLSSAAPHNVVTVTATAPAQPTTPAGASAEQQARDIDAILVDSAVGRAALGAAAADIDACRIGPTTMTYLQTAIDNRSSLISRLDALSVSSIPEGASLKAQLRAALVASYDADVAYRNWLTAAGSACPRTSDAAYAAVQEANTRATATKTVFVALWNPVAVRYGLPTRNANEI